MNLSDSQKKESRNTLMRKNRYRVKCILSTRGVPDRQLNNEDVIYELANESSFITVVFPYVNAHKSGDTEGLTMF